MGENGECLLIIEFVDRNEFVFWAKNYVHVGFWMEQQITNYKGDINGYSYIIQGAEGIFYVLKTNERLEEINYEFTQKSVINVKRFRTKVHSMTLKQFTNWLEK